MANCEHGSGFRSKLILPFFEGTWLTAVNARRPSYLGQTYKGGDLPFVCRRVIGGRRLVSSTHPVNKQLRQRIVSLDARIKKENESTKQLRASIDALRDPKAVERLARERFGYAKPGETMIRFEEAPSVSLEPQPSLTSSTDLKHLRHRAQTVMISFSLWERCPSIFPIYSSVNFCKFFFRAFRLVFSDPAIVGMFFQLIHRVATNMSNRNARVLRHFLDDFDKLLPPFRAQFPEKRYESICPALRG